MPTPATVPALIPLSLLEAIRNLDTPLEDGLDELAEDIAVRYLHSPHLQEQTRRHCFVTSLLRVPHLVICVNKMDLVGYSEDAFRKNLPEGEEFNFLAKPFSLKQLVEAVKQAVAE